MGEASTKEARINNSHSPAEDTSHIPTGIMEKLQCQIVMQVLQIKEQRGDLTIPQSLWNHYFNAILENDQKFSKVFQEKATNFLEATT